MSFSLYGIGLTQMFMIYGCECINLTWSLLTNIIWWIVILWKPYCGTLIILCTDFSVWIFFYDVVLFSYFSSHIAPSIAAKGLNWVQQYTLEIVILSLPSNYAVNSLSVTITFDLNKESSLIQLLNWRPLWTSAIMGWMSNCPGSNDNTL